MPELQQYEYRDLINVRKEILDRFEWVINELEQTIENLETRRLSVDDAQQRINRPLVKEVCYIVTLIYRSRLILLCLGDSLENKFEGKKNCLFIVCDIVR
jgi:hypothetical protein